MTDNPPHPYWCDDCGGRAPFTIAGCPIDHDQECPRFGEDAMEIYSAARQSCFSNRKAHPMNHPADSFMSIFGFKRVASIRGNVIEPAFEVQCAVCGEVHRSDEVPFSCETGDGE